MENRYFDFIDGLRALAVILVVLFHIDPELIPGGFIGVDLFFVISGFVITHAIFKSNEKNDFKNFYFGFVKSRVKRLAPAFIGLIIFLSFFNFVFLTPDEFSSFVKSQISAATFLSNVYFSQSVDYFAAEAKSLHLLHTWSLSVEWQFYFVFPILLYYLRTIRTKYAALVILLLLVIGALANLVQTNIDSNQAFYFTPYRFFQFFAGSFIYVLYLQGGGRIYLLKEGSLQSIFIISFIGCIYWAHYLSTESTYPGYNSFVPTLAAAVLILTGLYLSAYSYTHRMLSWIPIKWVGNASYSIYLWHWPVIIYVKMFFPNIVGFYYYIIVIFITMIFSFASYQFIEKYFRYKKVETVKLSCASLAAMLLLSTSSYLFDSETRYFRETAFKNMSLLDEPRWTKFPGQCKANQENDSYINCKIGDPDAQPKIVFYGDSQVQMLSWSLHEILKGQDESAIILAKGGCPPLAAFKNLKEYDKSEAACKNLFNVLEEMLANNKGLEYLVISARWKGYAENGYISHIAGDNYLKFPDMLAQSVVYWKMKNVKVLLVSDYPEPGYSIPSLRFRYAQLGIDIKSSYEYMTDKKYVYLAAKKADYFFEPTKHLCNSRVCPTLIQAHPTHFDSTHLSRSAATVISNEIIDVLQ